MHTCMCSCEGQKLTSTVFSTLCPIRCLTEPSVHCFSQVGWLAKPVISSVFGPSTKTPTHSAFMWLPRTQTYALRFAQVTLHLLSHLPNPHCGSCSLPHTHCLLLTGFSLGRCSWLPWTFLFHIQAVPPLVSPGSVTLPYFCVLVYTMCASPERAVSHPLPSPSSSYVQHSSATLTHCPAILQWPPTDVCTSRFCTCCSNLSITADTF